jgi:hypothetical protein
MFAQPLPFAINYVSELSNELRRMHQSHALSNTQQSWMSFCLTGMLLTNSLCWAVFERIGLGLYRIGALSWMFCHSKVMWSELIQASVALLLRWLKCISGTLVLDDSDHRRAKQTSRIYGAHKVFDKKTGGYFNGQCLMFALLVTDTFTFPVGFAFYRPDPKMSAWKKENKRLIKAKVKPADRPEPPGYDPKYPGKAEIALSLIDAFRSRHPGFIVKAVLADAAFGTAAFMEAACKKAGCEQTISQLRENQIVVFRNKAITVKHYFDTHAGTSQCVRVRGGQTYTMTVSSARLMVKAHALKRFVIAVKNEGESEYRYLVATDLSWRTLDILQCYTLRWLVEVFFADWKLYEGWAGLAKQPDEEGSVRGVTLSLLLDHALLIHPEQLACLEKNTPARTVGSLRQASYAQAFLEFVRKILMASEPAKMLEQLSEKIKELFVLAPSKKHMNTRDIGRQEPTPSLRSRAVSKIASPKVGRPVPAAA